MAACGYFWIVILYTQIVLDAKKEICLVILYKVYIGTILVFGVKINMFGLSICFWMLTFGKTYIFFYFLK